MPQITLDAADANELGQLLEFLADWLAADGQNLNESLCRFLGHPAYRFDQLRADLHRFTFLIGSSDGEDLFGTDT